MQNRIRGLENANSIFLLDKERGQYWSEIKTELEKCSSQREYNELLQFENRDLEIRETKTKCYTLVREIVLKEPLLMENKKYETPESAIELFCEETRTDLEKEDAERLGLHSGQIDEEELKIYRKVAQDINSNRDKSFFFKKILGHFDKGGSS
ncbi:hypothetical protein ACP275_13G053100 [Erythranthe tilingii]